MDMHVRRLVSFLQADEAAGSRLCPDGGAAGNGLQLAVGGALPLPRLCFIAPSH